jgi:hypothetical protein
MAYDLVREWDWQFGEKRTWKRPHRRSRNEDDPHEGHGRSSSGRIRWSNDEGTRFSLGRERSMRASRVMAVRRSKRMWCS